MHPQEKTVKTYDFLGIPVELVKWTESIWCGKVGYAVNNTDEPDVEKIAADAKSIFPNYTPNEREENWEACLSFNYLSSERPNGVMFGFLVASEEQAACYDIIKIPESMYMKIEICDATFKALHVEPWTGGIPPYEWIGEAIAPACGYAYGDDALPIIEYYKHDSKTHAIEACYLYVPVQRMLETGYYYAVRSVRSRE